MFVNYLLYKADQNHYTLTQASYSGKLFIVLNLIAYNKVLHFSHSPAPPRFFFVRIF